MPFTKNAMTFDNAIKMNTGVFMQHELERLDAKLHWPLVDYQWARDIKLRTDVTLADEVTSFLLANYAAVGGANPGGKNFIGSQTSNIGKIQIGTEKITQPMNLWALSVEFTIFQLAKAQQVGRALEADTHTALRKKWQMDIDEQVYIGDEATNAKGLLNQDIVIAENASSLWDNLNPDQILKEFNDYISMVWERTGWALFPRDILIPPMLYGSLVSRKVSANAERSILTYLKENNIAKAQGIDINFKPSKWCNKSGVGGKGRIASYSNDESIVRLPLVQLASTPVQLDGLSQKSIYYGAIGTVEVIRPEAMAYLDGAI